MQNSNTIKILFFGDIVGRPGRFAVRDFLKNPLIFGYNDISDIENCFVIANVENASHGFGLTEKNYIELSSYGIHCMTSGNHIWDKKEIKNYINSADKIVRPINYPNCDSGQGIKIFDFNGNKIAVINALGRVFMSIVNSQWDIVKNEIEKIKEITPIIIIDFHAEATAEKICFAKYCAELGCSVFVGTHTHVQTADETIIYPGTGYITDVGFCGCSSGVIGMDYKTSLNRFLTSLPEHYEVATDGPAQINALRVDIETEKGYAVAIKRVFCSSKDIKEENSQ